MSGLKESSTFFIVQTLFSLIDISFSLPGLMIHAKFSTELKFESVDIWIDDEGYTLLPHIDDGRIKLALQIYLGDNNVGTSLYANNGNIKTFEYKFNSGYALLSNAKSFHGLDNPVKNSGRTSLYVRYS